MPPTTPCAGKFNSYGGSTRPQPHGPYHGGQAQSAPQDHAYGAAYRSGDRPYDMPPPHASHRGGSVSSATARERHHSSDCPVSENPYSSPQPRSPRQHAASCPCRHSSSGVYGAAITASYGEMCYHDNSLVSASLEALIQHLVPTVDYYPDVRPPPCPRSAAVVRLRPSDPLVSSPSEILRLHLPAELPPLPAPVRAHDPGVSPVRGAAAVRRRPAG